MSSIESFGSLDDYGHILETFPILQFESTKKAFSNFVKIEKEAKDSIKEAKLEFEKHKKYLRLQLENYKKVKNVIQQFQVKMFIFFNLHCYIVLSQTFIHQKIVCHINKTVLV